MGSQEPTEAQDLSKQLGTDFGSLLTLLYTNSEVNVPMMEDPSKTQTVEFRIITDAESPSDFLARSTVVPSYRECKGIYSDWRDGFNAFYSNEKASRKLKVTNDIIQNRCYACFDLERQRWDRIRLLKWEKPSETVTVFFYGTLKSRDVPVGSLMELLPAFAKMPVSVHRAELVDIRPVGGGTEWSEEACNFFRDHVKGKTFRTLIVRETGPIVAEGINVGVHKLGVVMQEKNMEVKGHLQEVLVTKGYAEMTGPCYPGVLDLPGDEYPTSTSFFAETSLKPRETRRDREQKKFIDAAMEETRRLTERYKFTKKGEKSQKQRLSEKMSFLQCQFRSGIWGPFEYVTGFPSFRKTSLPTDMHMSIIFGHVKISHIHNPAWMYLQICKRLPLLEAMEVALGRYVESRLPVPQSEDRVGIAIACLFQKRPRRFEDPVWARAIVLSYKPAERLMKVLMVDYGSENTMHLGNTRYMPQSFRLIPSFAHRVFLNCSHVFPKSGTSWEPEFLEEFRQEAANKYETSSDLFATTHDESIFSLTSYCQRIAYENGQWAPKKIAKDDPDLQKFRRLDNQLDNPMLHHFYTTFGVKLYFDLYSRELLDGWSVRHERIRLHKKNLEAEELKKRMEESEANRKKMEKIDYTNAPFYQPTTPTPPTRRNNTNLSVAV